MDQVAPKPAIVVIVEPLLVVWKSPYGCTEVNIQKDNIREYTHNIGRHPDISRSQPVDVDRVSGSRCAEFSGGCSERVTAIGGGVESATIGGVEVGIEDLVRGDDSAGRGKGGDCLESVRVLRNEDTVTRARGPEDNIACSRESDLSAVGTERSFSKEVRYGDDTETVNLPP